MLDCIVPNMWDDDLHVLPASHLLEQAERELQGTAGALYRIAEPLSKISLPLASATLH